MGIKRVVDTSFWTDDKVVSYYSPEDKYFFLYLLTNPHASLLGAYQIHKKIMSFETGYTQEIIHVLLDRFENKYQNIMYNNKTNEIGIRNALRYSVVSGGKPIMDLLTREARALKDRSLVRYVADGARETNNRTIQDFISKIDIIVPINNNVDDYDYVYVDSYHDSSTIRTTIRGSDWNDAHIIGGRVRDRDPYILSISDDDVQRHNEIIEKVEDKAKGYEIPFSVGDIPRTLDLVGEYGLQNVLDAMDEAALGSARTWKYIIGILRNWKERGGKDKPRKEELIPGIDIPRGGIVIAREEAVND